VLGRAHAGARVTLRLDFLELWAVPGVNHIIDQIDPITGLTAINGKDAAAVLAAEPLAVRMTWEDWREAASARQLTPITWSEVSEALYEQMLECLPPAFYKGGAFLVGEPADHCFATGSPRFDAFRHVGASYYGASRPLTIAEMKAECAR
jgi:hypothetical protein